MKTELDLPMMLTSSCFKKSHCLSKEFPVFLKLIIMSDQNILNSKLKNYKNHQIQNYLNNKN
jgi:hypothetical protein